MSRRLKLLAGYQIVLIEMVQAIDEVHGYPGVLEALATHENGRTEFEGSTWWRWRTGKRLFSAAIATKLIRLALKDKKVVGLLSTDARGHLADLFGLLEPKLKAIADRIIRLRIQKIRKLREGALSAQDFGAFELAKQLTALADQQDEFIRGFMAREPLPVSIIYERARDANYFDTLDTADILRSIALEEPEPEALMVIGPPKVPRKKARFR